MSNSSATKPKTFTLEQANACLPLVRAIVDDMVELSQQVVQRRQRLDMLFDGRRRGRTMEPYQAELELVEQELEEDTQRVREYIDELLALGVEPKSAVEGLVDFPCLMDGRLVYLCWRRGERDIQYWHELDAGFQGRQALPSRKPLADDRNSRPVDCN
jgi:hypothetical protein